MKISSYEAKAVDIFKAENINFEREKTYKDLKFGYYRYDFYIPSINTLIEIDGAQHFSYTKKFYKSKTDFQKAQGRDRRKNEYALAHKIPLYRIPYWEVDNINSFSDITQQKFLVTSIYHNDKLRAPK